MATTTTTTPHTDKTAPADFSWARQALLTKRAALLGRMHSDTAPELEQSETTQPLPEPGDAADGSVKDTDKDRLLTDAERASDGIRLIDEALGRLDAGTYGHCIDCDELIDPRRLRTLPEAQRCLDDQEIYDRDHPSGEHHATL